MRRVACFNAVGVERDIAALRAVLDMPDGDVDLVVMPTRCNGSCSLVVSPTKWMNDGSGNFSPSTTGIPPLSLNGPGMGVLDLNGDGAVNFADLDLVLDQWNQSCP